MKKILFNALVILLLFLLLVYVFSPYTSHEGHERKAVLCSVDIAAPAEVVFKYLSNSANASKWSVFVDHIVPINTTQVPDGMPGSKRRCFRNGDEKGMQWDEEILQVEQNRKRTLSIFNTVEFPMSASGLETSQEFTSLPGGNCRLGLSLYFNKEPSLMESMKMHIAAFYIKHIFNQNLENIKANVESESGK